MKKLSSMTSVAALLALSVAGVTHVSAAEPVMQMADQHMSKAADGKCGEAKCGAKKKATEAKKAAEAKCGDKKMASEKKMPEAKCGASKKG